MDIIQPTVFIGQVLYREKPKRNEQPEIQEVTVGRIGKKYFYLTGYDERYPVDKQTLKYSDKNYSQSNFQLYVDKQEILDKNEKDMLIGILQKHFGWSGKCSENTLEQLRQCIEILAL